MTPTDGQGTQHHSRGISHPLYTRELFIIRLSVPELPAWLDNPQTADSAGILEEYGAACDLHTPTAWDDDAWCLAVVFGGVALCEAVAA